MNNDDITVVTKYDMRALKMGKGKKRKKVKCSLSECHLDKGSNHGNKKCMSKESLGNNSGVVWKCFSTEISLLLKFWSSLQYNRELVSYGTLWIAHK